jgi:hypothetical protein
MVMANSLNFRRLYSSMPSSTDVDEVSTAVLVAALFFAGIIFTVDF